MKYCVWPPRPWQQLALSILFRLLFFWWLPFTQPVICPSRTLSWTTLSTATTRSIVRIIVHRENNSLVSQSRIKILPIFNYLKIFNRSACRLPFQLCVWSPFNIFSSDTCVFLNGQNGKERVFPCGILHSRYTALTIRLISFAQVMFNHAYIDMSRVYCHTAGVLRMINDVALVRQIFPHSIFVSMETPQWRVWISNHHTIIFPYLLYIYNIKY